MVKILLITSLIFCLSLSAKAPTYYENGFEPWGKDSDLVYSASSKTEKIHYNLANTFCQSMIHFFQVYISPIDGPRSSYFPSSSQYTLIAIQKYGVLKGICLGFDRLMRENHDPWVYETIPFDIRTLKHDPVR